MCKSNLIQHGKSEAPSSKIGWVLTYFVFWWPSSFWKGNAEGQYKIPCKIWSSWLENWVSYAPFCILAAILFFGGHFLIFFCRRSTCTTMQNLELLAWKLSELWTILCFGGHFVFWRPSLFFGEKGGRNLLRNYCFKSHFYNILLGLFFTCSLCTEY